MTLVKRQSNLPRIQEARKGAADYVPHLGQEEVRELIAAAETKSRNSVGRRDGLLIATLFDGCFRVSEARSLRPMDLIRTDTGWMARILGKGNKYGEVALSMRNFFY